MWANPKSFLHKQLCRFTDGYVDIQVDLLFTRSQSNNSLFSHKAYREIESRT